MTIRILQGDCRDVLRTLPDASVHACITSPPYWGLRSYLPAGHPDKAKEIGSEPTLQQWVDTMVEVFREVRRVLRDDGTLWLNLGDSYAGGGGGNYSKSEKQTAHGQHITNEHNRRGWLEANALKPKDLVGQPWRVAFALQQPYYAGQIKSAMDREWLAAMVDAEGCFFIHKRAAGTTSYAKFERADGSTANYERKADTFGAGLEVCNTSLAIIERIQRIVGTGTIASQSPEANTRRKQTIYRWRVGPNEARRLARELYPHLVAKQHQARLLFGCPSSGASAEAAFQALKGLHRGTPTDVDFPAPPSMFEPGWYLRQELIWGKKNPMPESIRDRFTKAHEQVFLLTKSATYYFDADAVQEPVEGGAHARRPGNKAHSAAALYAGGDESHRTKGGLVAYAERMRHGAARDIGVGHNARPRKAVPNEGVGRRQGPPGNPAERKLADPGSGTKNNGSFDEAMAVMPTTRNPRSVRWLASEPFKGSHYATYPPELIEPFILAGCPEGGTVLDPFGGSGTTGLVADRLHRGAILIDLDERNGPMARARITGDAPLFAEVEA
jgi:DNA modification methylase